MASICSGLANSRADHSPAAHGSITGLQKKSNNLLDTNVRSSWDCSVDRKRLGLTFYRTDPTRG